MTPRCQLRNCLYPCQRLPVVPVLAPQPSADFLPPLPTHLPHLPHDLSMLPPPSLQLFLIVSRLQMLQMTIPLSLMRPTQITLAIHLSQPKIPSPFTAWAHHMMDLA
jgi:hypothetical protein